jgi:hypothetical protein
MAIAAFLACRGLPALAVSALLLTIALSDRAEALQCPKGYRGAAGKCVMTAEHANKLYKEQQEADKKKAAQQRQNHRLLEAMRRGKWNKSNANSAQANTPKNTKPVDVTGFGKYTKSANSKQPNVPDSSKAAGSSAPPKPVNSNSANANVPKPPSANSTKPNVPENSKATNGPKSDNTQMSNSSGPNVPRNDDKPGKGKRERADDDRGDNRKTAKARDDDDDDTPRKKPKVSDDDGATGKRKSARASDDDDGGKRKAAAKASGDDSSARSKPATTASLGTNSSGAWTHNSSRMSVADDGKQLTIAYDTPRGGLADLGIKPGTPLFKGTRDGSKVSGEATTFTRKCGTRTYPVSGTAADGRVELSGDKPVLGGDCSVTGSRREVMVFETGD